MSVKYVKCPRCHGLAYIEFDHTKKITCPDCKGSGMVIVQEKDDEDRRQEEDL